jgi:hypothetical protein
VKSKEKIKEEVGLKSPMVSTQTRRSARKEDREAEEEIVDGSQPEMHPRRDVIHLKGEAQGT